MKVAVYTIALNEAEHAQRWAKSCADADYRIVADTGSTDGTIEQLIAAGVTVHRIAVRPWRFDTARNAAMALIPDDVDVCCTLDMDMWLEPGWRERLQAAWTPEMTALYCQMVLNSGGDDPQPVNTYPAKNFHRRWGYRFKRAAHEALFYDREEVTGSCTEIVVQHARKQDSDHGQYLDLMEIAHEEDPSDAQICFWLGREHMWRGQNERAAELLQRYLALPTAKWSEERSEAMRYLAKVQPDQASTWLDRARAEAPHRREIWLDLAEHLHAEGDWLNLFWACANGIEKTRRTGSYLDDGGCWGSRLHDLGAIAAWRLKAMDRAVEWGTAALKLDPQNEGLMNRLALFKRCTAPGGIAPKPDPEVDWRERLQAARALRDLRDEAGFAREALATYRLRPDRPEPLQDLADFHLSAGRADKAYEFAEAALGLTERSPSNGEALDRLALCHSFSVVANWSSDLERRERGRVVCDWLALDRGIPENVRKTARWNSGWYAVGLGALAPSLETKQLSIPTPQGFHPGNLAICRRGDGYAVAVRAVNYKLQDGYHVKGDDPSYRSRMFLLWADDHFNLTEPREVALPLDLPMLSTETLGFEDPRPFIWRGALWCVASVRQINADARPDMVLARIDDSHGREPRLVHWRVLRSAAPPRWEKNWMPQVHSDELRFIYSMDPMRLLSETGEVRLEEPAPVVATTFFGGSQTVPFDGGWLTIVHESEWVNGMRRYFHRFAWLDAANRMQSFSRRFFFHSPGYEFVAGMAWRLDGRGFVISFSRNDHDPFLASIGEEDVRSLLVTPDALRLAKDRVIRDGKAALQGLGA